MIYHGKVVSTTPGTAVPLSSSHFRASFITIYPRVASGTPNAGEIRIGGMPTSADNIVLNGAVASIPSGSGIPLNPGDAAVVWPMTGPNPVDIATIYMDVDNSGDGVQFVYGRP
jgi:hypothetical protein